MLFWRSSVQFGGLLPHDFNYTFMTRRSTILCDCLMSLLSEQMSPMASKHIHQQRYLVLIWTSCSRSWQSAPPEATCCAPVHATHSACEYESDAATCSLDTRHVCNIPHNNSPAWPQRVCSAAHPRAATNGATIAETKAKCKHLVGVAGERVQRHRGAQVPQLDGAVVGGAGQVVPRGRVPRQRRDPICVRHLIPHHL